MILNKNLENYKPMELSENSLKTFLTHEKINGAIDNFLGIDSVGVKNFTEMFLNYKWFGVCNLYMAHLFSLSNGLDGQLSILDSYEELKKSHLMDVFFGYQETELDYLLLLDKIPFVIKQKYFEHFDEYTFLDVLSVTGDGCFPSTIIEWIKAFPVDQEEDNIAEKYINENIDRFSDALCDELHGLAEIGEIFDYKPTILNESNVESLNNFIRPSGYQISLISIECPELDIYIDSIKDNVELIDDLKTKIDKFISLSVPYLYTATTVQIIDRSSNIFDLCNSKTKCNYQIISLSLQDYYGDYNGEYAFNFELVEKIISQVGDIWRIISNNSSK